MSGKTDFILFLFLFLFFLGRQECTDNDQLLSYSEDRDFKTCDRDVCVVEFQRRGQPHRHFVSFQNQKIDDSLYWGSGGLGFLSRLWGEGFFFWLSEVPFFFLAASSSFNVCVMLYMFFSITHSRLLYAQPCRGLQNMLTTITPTLTKRGFKTYFGRGQAERPNDQIHTKISMIDHLELAGKALV